MKNKETNHTPGPWETAIYEPTENWLTEFAPKKHLAVCQTGNKKDPKGLLLAIVGPTGDSISLADANLIAAAPDLLAALVSIRFAAGFEELLKSKYGEKTADMLLKDIDKALAKAKGEVK